MESSEEQPRSYLYTVGGYAIIIGGIYVYYKYTQSDRQRGRANTSGSADRTTLPPLRQEQGQPRPKRQDSSRTADAVRRRKNNKPAAPSNPFEALPRETTADEPEADTHDLAYAESMAALREGNKLSGSKSRDARKQAGVRNVSGSSEEISSDSRKTNGQSPGAQPPSASQSNVTRQAGVSDMLEPGVKAPSSLRVAPKEEKPAVIREDGWATVSKAKKEPSKQPTSAANAETESKKQRQNKKKTDEQKARIQEAEQIRQSQLEEQRRTARVARGEAAKDGSKQTSQAINRWNERELNGGAVQAPVVPAPVPAMLDTFDQDGASTASSKDNAATWSPVSNSTANTNWGEGLPDEREQARILAEQDDTTWNTVTDKKKNRRKQPKADTEESAPAESVKPVDENLKTNGANGAHGSNGINGAKAPKINAPVESVGDDAGWSVA